MEIVPFSRSAHARKAFSCGNPELDNYLKKVVSQDVKKKLTVCFVLVDENSTVKGFYTLASASIPNSMIPTTYAKKFGVYAELPLHCWGDWQLIGHWQAGDSGNCC